MNSESARAAGFAKKCSPALLRQAASIAYGQFCDGTASGGKDREGAGGQPPGDLYAGRLGLAVLQAVRHALDLDGGSKEAALETLRLDALQAQQLDEAGGALPVGGLIGSGAMIYARVLAADALGEKELLSAAGAMAERLGDRQFEADRELDVLKGSAGAVLALLALERSARVHGLDRVADLALDRAVAAGRHLLAARSGQERRAWANPHGAVLTGFAHGAAGIGCALRRLAAAVESGGCVAVSGDLVTEWLAAADAAEAFEEELYDADEGRWRVHVRDAGESGPSHAWCHGSPGIVLARLEAWRSGERDEAAGARLERALRAAITAPLSDTDHLCCGNFGRAWILAEASRRLRANPDRQGGAFTERLAHEAAVRADRLVYDALRLYKRRQSFGFAAEDTGSLFKGPPGLCLALFALSEPDRVPCLLDLSAPAVS